MSGLSDTTSVDTENEFYVLDPQVVEVPEDLLKELKQRRPRDDEYQRASISGLDGTDRGYRPDIRSCWRKTIGDKKECSKFRKILQKFLRKATGYNKLQVERSHFDYIKYRKTQDEEGFFKMHRDAVSQNWDEDKWYPISVIIALDSKIKMPDWISFAVPHPLDGATVVETQIGERKGYPHTTMPGKALLVPSRALHGSEPLTHIGDYKEIFKCDAYLPLYYKKRMIESLLVKPFNDDALVHREKDDYTFGFEHFRYDGQHGLFLAEDDHFYDSSDGGYCNEW